MVSLSFRQVVDIATALKPLVDMADNYDSNNTYRPSDPSTYVMASAEWHAGRDITLSDCLRAKEILAELME